MMGTGLSEYERQRLENIKRNQEILKSLNISGGLISDDLKKLEAKNPTVAVKKVSKPKVKREIEVEVESRRVSSRIRNKALLAEGLPALEEEKIIEGSVRWEEKPAKPKRIIGKIPFDPEEGATEGFLTSMKELNNSSYKATTTMMLNEEPSSIADKLEVQNEYSVIKLMRERIYSVAIHPDPSKVIICAGGKFGQLGILDATEISHPIGLAERESTLPQPEDYHPKMWLFKPHTESVSNLHFNLANPNQLFSTAYDNIVRTMDLSTGEFEQLYDLGEDDDLSDGVITGFDCSTDGNLMYFSNTSGWYGQIDRREKNAVIQKWQLHDKKIGCVSVSPSDPVYLATSSNDDTVCLWDRRMFKVNKKNSSESSEPLHTFTFKRAVTSVYFHPRDSGRLMSTCYDDHVRIHYNVLAAASEHRHAAIHHNNQTGRWITNFKAVWDPKSTVDRSLGAVGNMNRGVDLIDGEAGNICRNILSDYLTAQPAVNCFHPSIDLVASGNASGKIAIWSQRL